MCLDSIDKKTKKHRYGFKLFERTAIDGVFKSRVYSGLKPDGYAIGKTYNAQKTCSGSFLESYTIGDRKYKAGYHYFLRLKDAKRHCNSEDAIVKIEVKGNLATGTDMGEPAGVSKHMKLLNVVTTGERMKEIKKKKRERKMIEEITSKEIHLDIIEFAQKSLKQAEKFEFENLVDLKPSESTEKVWTELADKVSQSLDVYKDYITFVDGFNRFSRTFRILTRFHVWATYNHEKYAALYKKIIKLPHDDLPMKRQWDMMTGPSFADMVEKINVKKYRKRSSGGIR